MSAGDPIFRFAGLVPRIETNQGGRMSNSPIETKRAGPIKATIWENQNEKGQTYHSVTITRTYRDGDGDWKETGQHFTEHLPMVQHVASQAYGFIQDRLDSLRAEKAAAKREDGSDSEKPAPESSRGQKKSHTEKVTEDRATKTAAASK